MTRFLDTAAADAFIASADSRETSREVMEAIASLARSMEEAEALWADGYAPGLPADRALVAVTEIATGNGRLDAADLFWGGRSLAACAEE